MPPYSSPSLLPSFKVLSPGNNSSSSSSSKTNAHGGNGERHPTSSSFFSSGKAVPPPPPLRPSSWCLARRRDLFPPCEAQLIRSLQLFSLTAGFCYVAFRWYTLLTSGLLLGSVFVMAETILICLVQPAHVVMTWRPLRRDPLELERVVARADFPSVDVMVPCYTEPAEVIEETVRAAVHLDYPVDKLHVYVLDDGGSPEVKRMVDRVNAESVGAAPATYIARAKQEGVPHHAKAGNVNHALFEAGTSGQMVVIFDCDMVCLPRFLNMTLGHFYKYDEEQRRHVIDESMALVQTPQDFFNLTRSDHLGQRYLAFYDYLMPCWEGHNTVPCCGTNVVFSRKALSSVGGLSTVTITEDVHTSMRLTAAGYRGAYVNEHMAFGLVPTDIQSYCKQRRRWAIGSLQIFLRDPPYLKKGLTVTQRLLYTWLNGQYLLCLPYLVLTALPLVYLTSPDLVLNRASIYDYLAFFLPYYVPLQLVGLLSSRDVGLLYWLRGQQETVYNVWTNLEAVLLVFANIRVSFSVTPKDASVSSPMERNLPFVMPHLTYWMVAASSIMIWAMLAIQGRVALHVSDVLSYSIAILATLSMAAYMYPPIAFCFRPPASRKGFSEEPQTFADFLAMEGEGGSSMMIGYGMDHVLGGGTREAEHTPLLYQHNSRGGGEERRGRSRRRRGGAEEEEREEEEQSVSPCTSRSSSYMSSQREEEEQGDEGGDVEAAYGGGSKGSSSSRASGSSRAVGEVPAVSKAVEKKTTKTASGVGRWWPKTKRQQQQRRHQRGGEESGDDDDDGDEEEAVLMRHALTQMTTSIRVSWPPRGMEEEEGEDHHHHHHNSITTTTGSSSTAVACL